jgi:hypothetical protein
MAASTLEMLRESLPDGLYRLERAEQDATEIVETWL